MIILFQTIWQILRVEVVTLLVGLVDGAVALVLGMWQLDYVLFIDVGTIF